MKKKLVERTLYSLSAEAPACPDRRQEERYVSLLRVGALMIDGRRELCLIRNISGGGMMIRPYSPIAAGTHICVELKHGDAVSGVAQWSEKGLVGVIFDTPIDVLALLNASGLESRPRMPRIELRCAASLRHDGKVYRASVVNVSQGGICLTANCDVPVDADVIVDLPGLPPAPAVVKWTEDGHFGIGFLRVFPVPELMAFLQEQKRELEQERMRATG